MSFTKVIMNPTVQGLDRLQCCTLICTSYFFENQLVELIMWRLYIKLDAWATTVYGANATIRGANGTTKMAS